MKPPVVKTHSRSTPRAPVYPGQTAAGPARRSTEASSAAHIPPIAELLSAHRKRSATTGTQERQPAQVHRDWSRRDPRRSCDSRSPATWLATESAGMEWSLQLGMVSSAQLSPDHLAVARNRVGSPGVGEGGNDRQSPSALSVKARDRQVRQSRGPVIDLQPHAIDARLNGQVDGAIGVADRIRDQLADHHGHISGKRRVADTVADTAECLSGKLPRCPGGRGHRLKSDGRPAPLSTSEPFAQLGPRSSPDGRRLPWPQFGQPCRAARHWASFQT
jgi:hypothetical protein